MKAEGAYYRFSTYADEQNNTVTADGKKVFVPIYENEDYCLDAEFDMSITVTQVD